MFVTCFSWYTAVCEGVFAITDQEFLDQFQMLIASMANMEARLERKIEEESKASERRTKLLIENQVTKRIDTLLDGYKLTHEKQYELERRMEDLERIVRELQERTA